LCQDKTQNAGIAKAIASICQRSIGAKIAKGNRQFYLDGLLRNTEKINLPLCRSDFLIDEAKRKHSQSYDEAFQRSISGNDKPRRSIYFYSIPKMECLLLLNRNDLTLSSEKRIISQWLK